MELMLLCALAVVISKYLKKHSETVYSIHAIFFVIYLLFALFNSDFPVVVFFVEKICGTERYEFFSSLFEMPFGWVYSANVIIALIEIVMALIVALMAIQLVVKKIGRKQKEFNCREKEGRKGKYLEEKFIAERKIFLRYCRLLN